MSEFFLNSCLFCAQVEDVKKHKILLQYLVNCTTQAQSSTTLSCLALTLLWATRVCTIMLLLYSTLAPLSASQVSHLLWDQHYNFQYSLCDVLVPRDLDLSSSLVNPLEL